MNCPRSIMCRTVPAWAGAAALFLAAAAGCSSPRFVQRQSVRDARMHKHVSAYAAHEKGGGERISGQLALHRRLRAERLEHLDSTRRLIKSSYADRKERLADSSPQRRAAVRRILRGNPETIDDTFAKMAY